MGRRLRPKEETLPKIAAEKIIEFMNNSRYRFLGCSIVRKK